jgi:hypothetical protein
MATSAKLAFSVVGIIAWRNIALETAPELNLPGFYKSLL